MSITALINKQHKTAFSFELLPPLKGNNIHKVFDVIEQLKPFQPLYINITSHHSEYISKIKPDGSAQYVNVRKRPGSVAIAAAIQNKYGITAVPHIICKGFTKDETEYALIDLDFLDLHDLLLLRGDDKNPDPNIVPELYHQYASELQIQINNFNKGIDLDGDPFQPPRTLFSYGMACYPEKHAEANSIEEDIKYAKLKVDNGAQYLVTQMFFDNQKYFQFVQQLRSAGIHVPIIPGIKPIVFMNQLDVLPKVFQCSIPELLASELKKCENDTQAAQVGVEWGVQQCRELIKFGVPSLHFYTFMAVDSVKKIAQEIY